MIIYDAWLIEIHKVCIDFDLEWTAGRMVLVTSDGDAHLKILLKTKENTFYSFVS